jgi:hypothetical protein
MRKMNRKSHDNRVSKPDNNKNNNNDLGSQAKDEKENNTRAPPEVFDSSKYDAMNDMTKGASSLELTDRNAIIELQKKDALRPEEIQNRSLTASGSDNSEIAAPPNDSALNPILTEERARTIREIKDEETTKIPSDIAVQNRQENEQDVKAIDHRFRRDFYYQDTSITQAWTDAAIRQYTEMTNVGMELYSQFLRNATDVTYAWFKLWVQTSWQHRQE